MSEAWDDAQTFVRREAALLLPLGFATLGAALLIYELIVPATRNGSLPPGPWMWGLVPVVGLLVAGCIAISALVVRPRISVGEALRVALAGMGAALILMVGFTLASTVLVMLFSLVAALIGGLLGWGIMQSSMLAVGLAMPLLVWASVRLLPVWAVIAERARQETVAAMVRRCLALTRGVAVRLLAVVLLFLMASVLLTSAVQFAFGSLLLIAGRAFGNPQLGTILTAVLMALVGSVVQTVWIVFVAQIYRRLAAMKGT